MVSPCKAAKPNDSYGLRHHIIKKYTCGVFYFFLKWFNFILLYMYMHRPRRHPHFLITNSIENNVYNLYRSNYRLWILEMKEEKGNALDESAIGTERFTLKFFELVCFCICHPSFFDSLNPYSLLASLDTSQNLSSKKEPSYYLTSFMTYYY